MNQQEDPKMPQKRIMATFVPQVRVGDNAMEIDGGGEFDVTNKVLALPALKIGNLSDYHDTTDALVDPEEFGHDGPFAVVVEQSVREFFSVANLSSDITDEMVAAARTAQGLSTDGKVPQMTGEFPVLFEIDPDSNEATGTVMTFCSPACRDACGGTAYPGFRKAKEGTSRLSDFGYDPQCEQCGVNIESSVGDSAERKLPPDRSAPTEGSGLQGPRRDPTKVSYFVPYLSGDVVDLGGQDWQVKHDTPGWYLTNTGDWKGEHPTIHHINSMNELIYRIEQALNQRALLDT
ncbi:TPA: hypothetical protein ACYLN4_001092 [Burkholderia lata]